MQLVTVQGSMSLDSPSAHAWFAMDAACRQAVGVDLTITSPAGAYRSPEMVLDMWFSSPARRKAVYGVPIGVSVARPKSLGGNGSVHENGRCVDINNWGDAAAWLRANSSKYGFRRTIATEPWHFQHDGTTTAGGGSAGIIPQEDDMPQLIRHPNGAIASVGETTYQFHDAATYDADSATFGAYKQVSEAQFNRAVANTQVRLAYLKAAIGGSPAAAVDTAAIAAKVEQTLADDFARLDAQIADLSVSVGPSAEEIAQAVRDEIIAPDA